ncbi:MAG: tetratricopeptide repeat protein [Candidatus Obscuribacterales bacterium]|nr:tetratricopeptide repeat protein [Candidatus Obscuribacterales bacterium]
MTAPDVSLYDRAVLDPQNSFGDPELRAARVMTTNTGAPASWSGSFANVYLLESGAGRIALRCFLKELEGQESHYSSIAKEFNSSTSPFAVNFVFLPKGIRINNQWLPLVKMEWIDGQLLGEFTGQNLTKPERFRYLAGKYLEMSRSMRAIGVAHGDLNPTNIFVFNRSFKLIDYDAMFVPSLAGSTGCESGLRLYQHPNRQRNHFGPFIDNFSDWIHYTTLLVYSVEPSLFVNAGIRNNYALFQQADYVNPAQSRLFNYLKNHGNPEIRGLALHVERLLGFPFEHVPVLDPARIQPGEIVAGAPPQASPQPSAQQQRGPEQVPPQQSGQQQGVPQQPNPQQFARQEVTPQQLNPQQFARQEVTPQQPNPQQFARQEVTPQQPNPQQFARQEVTPQQHNPQQFARQEVTPQQPDSQQFARQESTPQQPDSQQFPRQESSQRKDSPSQSRLLRPRPTQTGIGRSNSAPPVSSSEYAREQPLISPLAGTPETDVQTAPVFSGGLAGIDRSGNSARKGSSFGSGSGEPARIDRSSKSGSESSPQTGSVFGEGLLNNAPEEIAATDPRRAGGLGAGLAGGGNSSSGYQSFGVGSDRESGGQSGRGTSAASRGHQHESLIPSVGIIFGATIAVSLLTGVSVLVKTFAPQDNALVLNMVANLATFVAWVFAGTQYMMWLNKAYRNLQNGGVYGTKFGGTAFLVTLILPILNCIVPYLTMQELAKASKPNEGPNSWKTSASSPLIFCWAFAWASISIGTGFGSYLAMIADPQSAKTMEIVSSILSVVMTFVAAMLCGLTVKKISQMQEQKFTRELSEDSDRSSGDAAGMLGTLTMVGLSIASMVPASLMASAMWFSWMDGSEAKTALEEKDYMKAISICEKHQGYSSIFVDLRIYEAKAYAGLKEYDKAIEIYDQVIKANPDAAEAWIERGSAKIDIRKSQDAIIDLNKAIELDNKNSRAFCMRARALIARKQYPKALEDVDTAIGLDSTSAYPHFLKGMVLIATNRYDEALPFFEKTAELDPNYPAAFYNLGTCYQKLNQPAKAKSNFEKSAQMYRDAGDESNAADAEKRLKMLDNR